MGYRFEFLTNAGSIAVHSEAFLHLMDREVAPRPLRVLLADIGNGGAHEVWEAALPEGSYVRSLDMNPAVERLPINVVFCDVEDKADVTATLSGEGLFDVIVDATNTLTPWLWPWLREGGLMIYENVADFAPFTRLAEAVISNGGSWLLPAEEVMRLSIYGPVVSVEKRAPRVVPYMKLMTGNFADIVSESDLIASGVKRAIVSG